MFQLIGDHAGCHGAEKFSILAGLDLYDANELGNAFGEFAHRIELMCFPFSAALAKHFEPALVRIADRNGQALREKIIARVSRGDFDLIGFTAETYDVAGKNDFGFHEVSET